MQGGGYKFIAMLLALVGAGAFFSGCHIGRPDMSRYMVNGVQYGVVDGPFRGRWWNYYERGRSFLEGGFYEEAIRDFETAIAMRSEDQAWARTYGMHFVHEYFPNRELGAALYYQGDYEEAIDALSRSYGQQESARTALFLGKARRAVLEATGGDQAAPDVTFADAGITTAEMRYTVKGVARDDTYVAGIKVGDAPFYFDLAQPEVAFEHEVLLQPGQNSVPVTVTDLLGKATVVECPIVADLDGPAVSFDTPLVVPGTVSGVVYDESGIESMLIAGKPVEFADAGNGEKTFRVPVDVKLSDGPVPFIATDPFGNATDGTLPVDALITNAQALTVGFASTAPRWRDVAPGLRALMVGEQVAMLVAQQEEGGGEGAVRVTIENIEEGDIFYTDEIVVALNIESTKSPLQEISLGDSIVPAKPENRERLLIKRAVPLPDKQGPHDIVARAKNSAEVSGSDQRTIVRQLQEIYLDDNKLGVAFRSQDTSPTLKDLEFEIVSLAEERLDERFNIVIGRQDDAMQDILLEYQLTDLVGENRQLIPELVPIEVYFTVTLREDDESVHLKLSPMSTETGIRMDTYNDVAVDKSEDEEIGIALRTVAKLKQLFPRLGAPVIDWNEPDIEIFMGENAGILPSALAVVCVREEVPGNAFREAYFKYEPVVCTARITSRGESTSEAVVLPAEPGGSTDYPIVPITEPEATEGYWVVLK